MCVHRKAGKTKRKDDIRIFNRIALPECDLDDSYKNTYKNEKGKAKDAAYCSLVNFILVLGAWS